MRCLEWIKKDNADAMANSEQEECQKCKKPCDTHSQEWLEKAEKENHKWPY